MLSAFIQNINFFFSLSKIYDAPWAQQISLDLLRYETYGNMTLKQRQ